MAPSYAAPHSPSLAKASPQFQFPLKNGVCASCVVVTTLPNASPTVLDFLSHHFSFISHFEWQRRLQSGEVFFENEQPCTITSPIKIGKKIFYYRTLANEAIIPFQEKILFEDDLLLVADKPHFLPVIPSGKYAQETLLARLKHRCNLPLLSPIHRIDRDTAGLVIFCKLKEFRGAYQHLFLEKKIHKSYEAIAPCLAQLANVQAGAPFEYRNRLARASNPMQQQEEKGHFNSHTRITLKERCQALAKYDLMPITGQRHQLRAHMHQLGAPILNDGIYPVLTPEGQSDFSKPLQLLAKRISFIDPITQCERFFTSTFRLLNWCEIDQP